MPKLSEDELLAALRARLAPDARPPLDEATLWEAEARLGFALPPLLRRLYGEVANGDFGMGVRPLTMPNEGFARSETETVVIWYLAQRGYVPKDEDFEPDEDQYPPAEWPERLLDICDWGCNIYSCIDCSQPEMPVLRNDNNISYTTLALEAPSLHEWLDGEKLFYLDWEAAPKTQLPPFQPHAKPTLPGTDNDA